MRAEFTKQGLLMSTNSAKRTKRVYKFDLLLFNYLPPLSTLKSTAFRGRFQNFSKLKSNFIFDALKKKIRQ